MTARPVTPGNPQPFDPEFNPHRNRTDDGVLIVEGLRVWTNNLDRGVIVAKAWDGDHPYPWQWWWRVWLDTDYNDKPIDRVVQMNGTRMSTKFKGEPA